jgi:hypothetical protein
VSIASGYTLTTSSDKTTIGLYFIFTCVTTYTLILFNKDSITVYFISGNNTDGTCVLDEGYITYYTYTNLKLMNKVLNKKIEVWNSIVSLAVE